MPSKRFAAQIWCVLFFPIMLNAHDNVGNSYLKTIAAKAQLRLDLLEVKRDRHALRLQSIRHLHHAGYASFKELTLAEVQDATNQTQLKAAHAYNEFVQELNAKSARPELGSASTAEAVITIPGLTIDPRTQPVAQITVQATNQTLKKALREADFSRRDAWQELASRLAKQSAHSPSLRYELAAAKLEMKQAELESELASQSSMLKQFRTLPPLTIEGETIVSIKQVLKLCETESTRLANIARRDAAKQHIALLSELDRRIQKAVQADASPSLESPRSLDMLVRAESELQQATETLNQLAIEAQNDVTLVSNRTVPDSSPVSNLTAFRIDQIRQALRERIELAEFNVGVSTQQRHGAQLRLDKLTELAEQHESFARERERQELVKEIADANFYRESFQLKLRNLELEYFAALTKDSSWKVSLQNIFQHHASSSATEVYFQKIMKLDTWRLKAMNDLHQQGAASWKEAMAAKVRLAETQSQIDLAARQREEAETIVGLLREITQPSDIQ